MVADALLHIEVLSLMIPNDYEFIAQANRDDNKFRDHMQKLRPLPAICYTVQQTIVYNQLTAANYVFVSQDALPPTLVQPDKGAY
ncbi:hypothetical protein NPIL_544411 [Nephila pilipes]|uniref:Uncharacterized protein n=1 Tax=Nephila pilipes TaxID=299642 RepID=A0A8X6PL55_NEPPI|nr:hypothetical protein NPIL_544411 [Nephila pilipes]